MGKATSSRDLVTCNAFGSVTESLLGNGAGPRAPGDPTQTSPEESEGQCCEKEQPEETDAECGEVSWPPFLVRMETGWELPEHDQQTSCSLPVSQRGRKT